MKWIVLAAVAACGCESGPPTDNFGEPFDQSVPSDVRLWVIDRQGCEHFSGEPTGGDPQRDIFLAEEVQRLCPGLEERQLRLKKRYGDRPDVLKLLANYPPLG